MGKSCRKTPSRPSRRLTEKDLQQNIKKGRKRKQQDVVLDEERDGMEIRH